MVSRRVVIFRQPTCERSFIVRHRNGEPTGLVIDGRAYAVNRLRRGRGIRVGDQLVPVGEQQLD